MGPHASAREEVNREERVQNGDANDADLTRWNYFWAGLDVRMSKFPHKACFPSSTLGYDEVMFEVQYCCKVCYLVEPQQERDVAFKELRVY